VEIRVNLSYRTLTSYGFVTNDFSEDETVGRGGKLRISFKCYCITRNRWADFTIIGGNIIVSLRP
jgi:hypothetical protein